MIKEYGVLHLFCGLGGAALGFQQAAGEYKGVVAKFRTLAGIDVDPEACQDFEMLTGAPAVRMDLFGRSDYMAFHGQEPPSEWREATPADLVAATDGECPDMIFLSPPCKGFSGLLPSEKSVSEKYQALNRLVLRGLRLAMDAFADDLPAVIMLENVPRITSRGASLLSQVRALLGRHGYAFDPPAGKDADGLHDCGELGGLGQHRRRYLLIARNMAKMSSFIYKPHTRRVRSIGEIIGPLPLPGDPAAGPMHKLPRLQWLTWLRLALIPAGGDWRDLNKIAPEEYRIEYIPRGGGPYGVQDWEEPAATVTGHPGPRGSNAACVADVRLGHEPRDGVFKVQAWKDPSTTVTGDARVNASNGAACVADLRLTDRETRHPGVYRMIHMADPAPCVTGTRFGSGAGAVADMRVGQGFAGKRQVLSWDGPATCVTGTADIQAGAQSIADTRLHPRENRRSNSHSVRPWDGAAYTVTGEDTIGSGAQSVSDTRFNLGENAHHCLCRVTPMDAPAGTVTGANRPASGGPSIADSRIGSSSRPKLLGVAAWDKPISTVTGSASVSSSNGVGAVADRREWFDNAYRVLRWHEPAGTVTSGHSPSCGATTLADPRLGCHCRNGSYGVQAWGEPAKTVIGAGDIHAGSAAVADPRIPGNREQGVWIIISTDGTWHRPLTTWELAALQGLPLWLPDGRPLVLAGKSDAKFRERIGNAVPPPAARATGEEILRALLVSERGDFVLSATGIWVAPEIDTAGNEGVKFDA